MTTTTRTRRTTLRDALRSQRLVAAIHRCGLAGCPEGGWPETQQAMRRIADELPLRDTRAYRVHDVVDALYAIDHAGRYCAR